MAVAAHAGDPLLGSACNLLSSISCAAVWTPLLASCRKRQRFGKPRLWWTGWRSTLPALASGSRCKSHVLKMQVACNTHPTTHTHTHHGTHRSKTCPVDLQEERALHVTTMVVWSLASLEAVTCPLHHTHLELLQEKCSCCMWKVCIRCNYERNIL